MSIKGKSDRALDQSAQRANNPLAFSVRGPLAEVTALAYTITEATPGNSWDLLEKSAGTIILAAEGNVPGVKGVNLTVHNGGFSNEPSITISGVSPKLVATLTPSEEDYREAFKWLYKSERLNRAGDPVGNYASVAQFVPDKLGDLASLAEELGVKQAEVEKILAR